MNRGKQTMEQMVANELLERKEDITIAGKAYRVAPPCLATLVMCSEEFSKIKSVEISKDNAASDIIRDARFAKDICRPLAVLILGAERIEKERMNNRSKWLRRLFRRRKSDLVGRLAHDLSFAKPGEITDAVAKLIARQDIGGFFALTTFLSAVHVTKPAKVGTETTQSGQ